MLFAYDPALAKRFRRDAGSVLDEIGTSLQMESAFRILFDSWSPSCVVSSSDLWPFEYQFALQASAKDIPSVVIQHGNLAPFYWPFAADHFAVWGKWSFDEMLAYGTPSSRLMVGGMPAADETFRRISTRTASNERPHDPVCVILSQTNGSYLDPELYANYKRFLSAVIPLTPFVRWKVKLHPSENRSFYDDLEPEIADKLDFYPQSTKLDDALRDADTVTTLYSTSGLQAMMAGRPLIIPIVSPRMTDPNLLPQIHGGFRVNTPEEFSREVEALVSNPTYRAQRLESQREALNHCFSNQGTASETIVDRIEECSRSSSARLGIAMKEMV
jgi:hypothetical protein